MIRLFGAILLVMACTGPAIAKEASLAIKDIEYTFIKLGQPEFERGMAKLHGREVQWQGWVEEIDPLNTHLSDGNRPVSVKMNLGSSKLLGVSHAVFLVSPEQMNLVREGLQIRFSGEIKAIQVVGRKEPALRIMLDKVKIL